MVEKRNVFDRVEEVPGRIGTCQVIVALFVAEMLVRGRFGLGCLQISPARNIGFSQSRLKHRC